MSNCNCPLNAQIGLHFEPKKDSLSVYLATFHPSLDNRVIFASFGTSSLQSTFEECYPARKIIRNHADDLFAVSFGQNKIMKGQNVDRLYGLTVTPCISHAIGEKP